MKKKKKHKMQIALKCDVSSYYEYSERKVNASLPEKFNTRLGAQQ